ncbi:MAG: hypothetical protein ACREE0_03850 [Phenylobacterium sp.]
MISGKDFLEYGSAGLVFVCGALAGHYAAEGMSLIQWAGAATAVMGSVTVAVAVRIWPAPAKAERQSD